jgi:VTC domain
MRKARQRHELKYVVDLVEGEAFIEIAKSFCTVDSHSDSDGAYEVASVYYDTRDLRFFYDRQESIGYRRKVRLRSYLSSTGQPVQCIEIKEKHKHLVAKKRVFTNHEIIDDFTTKNEFSLNSILTCVSDSIAKREIEFLHGRLNLQPVNTIRYIRKALTAINDSSVRITLDRRLTSGLPTILPYSPDSEKFILPPGKAILEIKSDRDLPLWLFSLLQRAEFRRVRFSKYCAAIENNLSVLGHVPSLRADFTFISKDEQINNQWMMAVGA